MSCQYLVYKNDNNVFHRSYNKSNSKFTQFRCGQCMNCRVQSSMELSWYSNLELQSCYKRGLSSSFCTLTYSDAFVPLVRVGNKLECSLREKDLSDFWKRSRQWLKCKGYNNKLTFISCGEYGDKFSRSHYHFVLFGIHPVLADLFISNNWHFGIFQSGMLTSGGINYVCKYMTKAPRGKLAKELFDDKGIERPFLHHSANLGSDWIIEHYDEIVENGFKYYDNGQWHNIPSYLRRKLDSFSEFDRGSFFKSEKIKARQAGFDSVEDYQRIKAYNTEHMLIDYARSQGVPVDSPSNFSSSIALNTTRMSRDLMESFVSEALDPIQF